MQEPRSLQEAIAYFADPDVLFSMPSVFAGRMASYLPTLRKGEALVRQDPQAVVLLRLQEAVHG